MLYTSMTKRALRIAFDAHKDQVDKGGIPYVFHPYHLAEQMEDELSACAALLHDVAEDTLVTFQDLMDQGISGEVIEILRLLTHEEGAAYLDYVRKIRDSGNLRAVRVKVADLRHNLDLDRLPALDEAARERRERYFQALHILGG